MQIFSWKWKCTDSNCPGTQIFRITEGALLVEMLADPLYIPGAKPCAVCSAATVLIEAPNTLPLV